MTKQSYVVGAIVAAVVVGAACSDDFPSLSTKAPAKEFFTAVLQPANERPTPVTGVNSSGTSTITIIDTATIRVETRVSTIDSVTQAHIHEGDANTAGPIRVFLLSNVAAGRAPITGTDRTLSVVDILLTSPTCAANGTNTPCFQGGTGAWDFKTLVTNIKNGTAYVNVHTRRNPGGEIRGQIVPQ
jgi:hypothetical protein